MDSPSMILFCKLFVQKFQKMLPKMIYWSPHRPINETGPRQLILTSNIKHHKTRSNIGIALSAVQYLGGLRMDARTLKEANFREGREHYYNWTMDIDCSCNSAPVIRYSAMTFNVTFFLFKFNAISQSAGCCLIISVFVKSVLFERRGCDDYLRAVIRSVFISASRVWSANILTGVRVILIWWN